MRAGDVVIDVYIDVIFFINFFMDFLLLILLRRVLKKPASLKRLAAAAAAGGLVGCVETVMGRVPPWLIVLLSFGGAGIMVTAAFGRCDRREWIKELMGLYLLAIGAGGMMEFLIRHTRGGFYLMASLKGETAYVMPLMMWVFLGLGTCFLAGALWQFGEELLKERSSRFPVILTDKQVVVTTTGYLDTGNCLREAESGQGVQIVTERIWNLFCGLGEEKKMIPYHTVGNPYGVMEGMRIERMEVKQTSITGAGENGSIRIDHPWIAKAPYGLTRDGSYEVLLHKEAVMGPREKEAV